MVGWRVLNYNNSLVRKSFKCSAVEGGFIVCLVYYWITVVVISFTKSWYNIFCCRRFDNLCIRKAGQAAALDKDVAFIWQGAKEAQGDIFPRMKWY